ncbi:MAG: hypothetical protein JSR33_11790 [Proteobacteria bacterium]|nr:hypothetical protein [Pseudomonadota bacterium]
MFTKPPVDYDDIALKASEIKSKQPSEDKRGKLLSQYYSVIGKDEHLPILCTLRSKPLDKISDKYFVLDYHEEIEDEYKAIYISVWLGDKDSSLTVTVHNDSRIAFPHQALAEKSRTLGISPTISSTHTANVYVYQTTPGHIKALFDILKNSLCPHRFCQMPDIGLGKASQMVRLDVLFNQLYERVYANSVANQSSDLSFTSK